MTASILIVKLLTDVSDKFFVEYFRKVDKTNLLVSSTFNIANNAAHDILRIETPNADKFCESLALDQNGNLMSIEDGHELRLANYVTLRQSKTYLGQQGHSLKTCDTTEIHFINTFIYSRVSAVQTNHFPVTSFLNKIYPNYPTSQKCKFYLTGCIIQKFTKILLK